MRSISRVKQSAIQAPKHDTRFGQANTGFLAATCTNSAADLDAQTGAANTFAPRTACGSISC
jgi:hypothetical protein